MTAAGRPYSAREIVKTYAQQLPAAEPCRSCERVPNPETGECRCSD